MEGRRELLDSLAGLFEYPSADFSARVTACRALADQRSSGHGEAIASLEERTRGMSRGEVEEMFTRTFEINPVCALEIGWHIYGEDYARGALLVKMRQQLREMNLPESRELPDHLTHVLALLGRLAGEEADEFAARYVIPGVDKMLEGMPDEDAPYRALLQSVLAVVKQDHDVEAVSPRGRKGDPPGLKNPLPIYGNQGCPKA